MKCGNPRESTDSYSTVPALTLGDLEPDLVSGMLIHICSCFLTFQFTKNLTQRLVGLFGIRDGASSGMLCSLSFLNFHRKHALNEISS
jgi:hypothetical protein